MTEEALLLHVGEAGRLLGLGRSKVYELLESGELKSLTIGRRRLVPRVEIDRFIQEAVKRAVKPSG